MKVRVLVVAISATAIGVVAILLTGASSPTNPADEFRGALNPPMTAPEDPGDLRVAAPDRSGQWHLSPTDSRLGKAVSAVLGTPPVVLATRFEASETLAGADSADLRGTDGAGYQVDWYQAFARWELDEAKPAQRLDGATYWVGGDGADIQSVYYLSDREVGLWVGHYSGSPNDQVSTEQLLAIAAKVAKELAKSGDARATFLDKETADD